MMTLTTVLHALPLAILAGCTVRAESNLTEEQRYAQHIAEQDAAVSETASAAAANSGQCGASEIEWQHDADTTVCTIRCVTDDDCVPREERCRILDVNAPLGSSVVFVDDAPQAIGNSVEAEAASDAAAEVPVPLAVCDPLYWEADPTQTPPTG